MNENYIEAKIKPRVSNDLNILIVEETPSTVSRTMSLLKARHKQNGGRLTWIDFDKILQSQGISTDMEEMDEIFIHCQREGIELVDEEADLDDVTTENVDTDLPVETVAIEGEDSLIWAIANQARTIRIPVHMVESINKLI